MMKKPQPNTIPIHAKIMELNSYRMMQKILPKVNIVLLVKHIKILIHVDGIAEK